MTASPAKDDLHITSGNDVCKNNVFTPNKPKKQTQSNPPSVVSSCKRRRLKYDFEDENSLVFTTMQAERSTFNDEDAGENIENQELLESAQRHISKLNNLEEDEELLYSARVKLFEFVHGPDMMASYYASNVDPKKDEENPSSRWVKRGNGVIKFMKQLEDSVYYGTVHLTMRHEGTRRLLLNHSVGPDLEAKRLEQQKDSKRKEKPSYVWTTEDHADIARERTFAVEFRQELDALEWKDWFERSKNATMLARLGGDSQDTSAGDEICSYMTKLSTSVERMTPSPKKLKRRHAEVTSS